MADKQVPPDEEPPSQQVMNTTTGVQQPTAPVTYPQTSPQPQMQYNSSEQPIVIQVPGVRTPPTRIEAYNSALSRKLGITQLVCGGLGLILNVIGIIIHATAHYEYYDSYLVSQYGYGYGYYFVPTTAYYAASGIWGMALSYSLSGAFALCAAGKKTKCTIITTMVLSIISSFFAFVMLCTACWAVGKDADPLIKGFSYTIYNHDYDSYGHFRDYTGYSDEAERLAKASMPVSVFFLAVSLIEFVACIWTATLCCKVICCGNTAVSDNSQAGAVRYTVPQPAVQYSTLPALSHSFSSWTSKANRLLGLRWSRFLVRVVCIQHSQM